jgi:response regulator RpfG family c-di-GMP phosphodiesterase
MNILVVDDERSVLELARYCLSERYELFLASSGPEALLILASRKIDVMITDQRMPGMDGSELCRQAAEVSPNTAQIMITAYCDFQDLRKAVSGGRLTACLQKPLRTHELVDAIERAYRPPPGSATRSQRPRSITPADCELRAAEIAAVAQRAGARAELRASRQELSSSLLQFVPELDY